MLEFLKRLFGKSEPVNFVALKQEGAQIIDVRTKVEYQSGHIKGSVNIPLQELNRSILKIKKENPIITCCASGARSSAASSILKSNGFRAYNGGSWKSLKNKFLKV